MRQGRKSRYRYEQAKPQFKRTKHTFVRRFGDLLAARDGGWFCYYCFIPLKRLKLSRSRRVAYYRDLGYGVATCDHKKPLCKGGTSELDNLVLCCYDCNIRKGDSDYKQFIKMLEFEHVLKSRNQPNQPQTPRG